MIVTAKNNYSYSIYNHFSAYIKCEKGDDATEVCEDYTVNISDEAKRFQNQSGAKETSMQVSTNSSYYGNTTATKVSSPQSTAPAIFAEMLEESVGITSPLSTGEGTALDNKSWMPTRLGTLHYQHPLAGKVMVGGKKISEIGQEISSCPEWYLDLAKIRIDPNDPKYRELMAEYHNLLKEAMEQVLNNNSIPDDNWSKHYENLIADTTKSEEIHQELLAKLWSDPRTAELMDILGVASGDTNIEI